MAEEKQSLLQKIRNIPCIAQAREKHKEDLKNYRETKLNKSAVLEESYVKKIDFLQGRDAVKTDRLLQIFNKDTTIVKKYIDGLIDGKPIDLTDSNFIKKYAHPDDFGKWSDWNYLGDGRYDLLYRRILKTVKKLLEK